MVMLVLVWILYRRLSHTHFLSHFHTNRNTCQECSSLRKPLKEPSHDIMPSTFVGLRAVMEGRVQCTRGGISLSVPHWLLLIGWKRGIVKENLWWKSANSRGAGCVYSLWLCSTLTHLIFSTFLRHDSLWLLKRQLCVFYVFTSWHLCFRST